jgi:dipeptidyl aminopeptidase/acylaminoacyl peptidase
MFDALRSKGTPVALIEFEGEGHGFRRTETIQRTILAELYFYSRIFSFQLPEPVDPVDIQNAPSA